VFAFIGAPGFFLSTFVMISQNRADAKRQVIAYEQWTTVQEGDQQNRPAHHADPAANQGRPRRRAASTHRKPARSHQADD
jgi:hypothetical protein